MSENYFKKFVEENSQDNKDITYELVKAVESLQKNSFLFDKNDWNASLQMAQKNPIMALALIKENRTPKNIRDAIMKQYRLHDAEPFLIYAMAHRVNLSTEEIDIYANKLIETAKARGTLTRHLDADIKMYKGMKLKDPPLNVDIANTLVSMDLDGKLRNIDGVQYRYADFQNITSYTTPELRKNLTIDEKALILVNSDIINEDRKTELANNKFLSEETRDAVFKSGVDYVGLRGITQEMASEMYRTCVETITRFSKEENQEATKWARDTLAMLFKAKVLSPACEMDFSQRWQELDNNKIDNGLFMIFLENCEQPSAIEYCCNIHTVSPEMLYYILSTKEICGSLAIYTKEKAMSDLIKEYELRGVLNTDRHNSYNRYILSMIRTCNIPEDALNIILKNGYQPHLSAMLKSPAIFEKTLRTISDRYAEDLPVVFCANLNIEMQNRKLDKYITQTVDAMEKMIQNQRLLKNRDGNIDKFNDLKIHFETREHLQSTIKAIEKVAKECDFNTVSDIVLPAFKQLQEEKYFKECHYEIATLLFKYQFGQFVTEYDILKKMNQRDLEEIFLKFPAEDLLKVKEDIEEETNIYITDIGIDDVEEQYDFINGIIPLEKAYNVVMNLITEKQKGIEKDEKYIDEEVEF